MSKLSSMFIVRHYYTACRKRLLAQINKKIKDETQDILNECPYLKVFKDKNFELMMMNESRKITLEKNTSESTIEITFFSDNEEMTNNMISQIFDDKDSQYEFINFQIKIKRNNNINFIQGFSMMGDYEINRCFVRSVDNSKQINDRKDSLESKGPVINTLNESLQENFEEYINNIGIDKELMNAMSEAVRDKEKFIEENWNKQIKSFLS